jgi:hypothetical protein
MTVFFRGVGPTSSGELRSEQAGDQPADSLAGLSVRVSQSGRVFNVPLFGVKQDNQCPSQSSSPSCLLTSIKVQIPFDIAADVVKPDPGAPVILPPLAGLVLSTDGQASVTYQIQPLPDNAHVFTTCDAGWDITPSHTCDRLASHLDGRPITQNAPATRGETISLAAFGLGQTSPRALTGKPAEQGMFVADTLGNPRVSAVFRSLVNAPSSLPRRGFTPDRDDVPAAIKGSTLVPGKNGIYELDIVVPTSLKPPVACSSSVQANSLLVVITSEGAENIGLCVQP